MNKLLRIRPKFVTFKKRKFIKQHVLYNDITKNMLSNIYGVHVYYAPYGSGKTTILQQITNEFNSNTKSNAKIIYINGSTLINRSLDDEIKKHLDIRCHNIFFDRTLNMELELYSKHNKIDNLILVIDDYDEFYNYCDYNTIYNYTCNLAESSVRYKVMNIFISVSDPSIARNILSFNGCSKFIKLGFSECKNYSLSDDQLKDFIASTIEEKQLISFSKKDIERITYLGLKAKNPLFIKTLIFAYITNQIFHHVNTHNDIYNNIYDIIAQQRSDEYENGINIINGRIKL